MKSNTPPNTFWHTGQSFLIIAPENTWEEIINQAITEFAVSKFDYAEVGQESVLSIEESRQIEEISRHLPSQGKVRLSVIKFIDNSSDSAANAMLKILEEVPKCTRLLLFAKTKQILPTIRSRCSEWSNRKVADIIEILLPLDKAQDFATVSLKIGKIVESNQSGILLDQWTRELIDRKNIQPVRWIIDARNMLSSTAINAQAMLEVTYLHLIDGAELPNNVVSKKRDHGNI
jgi:DNA polymerase III delta prime subunit